MILNVTSVIQCALTLVVGLFFVFLSRLVGVFEQVLPKTTVPNHSMLGSYPIRIDPASYLEYTRAYTCAYWHVKKRVRIEKSEVRG
jgi:hypothetical protein